MHIAFVTLMSGAPWAASEELWVQAAQRALDSGHRVSVHVYSWSSELLPIAELRFRGAKVYLRPVKRSRYWRNPFNALQKADFVAVNQGWFMDIIYQPDGQLLMKLLIESRTPYCLLLHSLPEFTYPDDMQREMLRKLHSRAAFGGFFSARSIVSLERLLATPLPSAMRFWSCCNASLDSDATWLPSDPVRFLMLGRLDLSCKGQDVVLHALSREFWRTKDWSLDIIGEGNGASHLLELVRHYNLEGKVRILAFNRHPQSLWDSYHSLIVASRHETGPLTAIECVLHGRLLVGTSVGSIPELIQDEISGYLIPECEYSAISLTLEKAWRARDNWEQMGRRAQAHARSLYPPDPVSLFYQAITGERARC